MESLLNVARNGGRKQQSDGHEGRKECVVGSLVRTLGTFQKINGKGGESKTITELFDADTGADDGQMLGR